MSEQGKLFDDLPVYLGRVKNHPLYSVWANMKTRCYNPKSLGFKDYGGRGIFVCDEWRNSSRAFVAWAIKAGWQPGLQLDRENNDGPYSPENCRFVTRLVNANNKRNNVRLADGTTLPEMSRRVGVQQNTLHMRIHRGMSPDEAAARPVHGYGFHKRGRFAPDGRALVDLARAHGLAPATVYARLDRGWSLVRALSAPLDPVRGSHLHGKRPLPDGLQSVGDAAVRVVAVTAAVALGESEASAQGDPAQRSAARRKPKAKRKGRAPVIASNG